MNIFYVVSDWNYSADQVDMFLETQGLFSVIGCVPLHTVDACEVNTHLFKEKTAKN